MSLLDQIVGFSCDDTLHPTCYVEALDTISDLHTARISLMGDSAPCLLHKDTDKLRVKASRLQPIDDCSFHSIEPRRKELLPKLLTHLINNCRSEIKPRHKSHQEENTNEYRIVLPHIICKSKIAATCQILLMQKVNRRKRRLLAS